MFKRPIVRIEPVRPDEWMDYANCAGMKDWNVPVAVCDGCPVTVECQALYMDMEELLDDGTQRGQHMDGTWAGVDHTARLKPTPMNSCPCLIEDCGRQARTAKLCNTHYTRWRNAKQDLGARMVDFIGFMGGEYRREDRNQFGGYS